MRTKLLRNLRERTRKLKAELTAIYLCLQDARTPWLAKVVIIVAVAYALSPIDLIPDFIPVLGYLDDLVLLPLLIALAIRLVPPQVLTESRLKAAGNAAMNTKLGRYAALLIVCCWLALLGLVISRWW